MIASRPQRGPSPLLPLSYLAAATVAFLTAALGVVWLAPEMAGHYYHPHLVALTHVVTLGWITLTIMGATYQLVPIVLERTIWSERLVHRHSGARAVASPLRARPLAGAGGPSLMGARLPTPRGKGSAPLGPR